MVLGCQEEQGMEKSIVEDIKRVELTRYPSLPRPLKIWFLILTIAGLMLAFVCVFGFSYRGKVFYPVQYYYLLIVFYSSNVFLLMPGRKKEHKVLWYDLVAAVLAFCIAFYFFLHAWEISNVGWIPPTPFQMVLALILSILILEGGRRMAGHIYMAVCLFFALYPMIAGYMPGIFFGNTFSFANTIGTHVFGSEGMTGLPAKTVGDILIGFLLFAAVLIASGAGDFLSNLLSPHVGDLEVVQRRCHAYPALCLVQSVVAPYQMLWPMAPLPFLP